MRLGWRNYLWGGLLLTLGLFLGGADGEGCGGKGVFESLAEDDTKEAKVETAKMALDDGDYDLAIATMASLCGATNAPTCEPELISLYASAYAGKAGLNVFDLISGAGSQSGGSGSGFTLFSKHFATRSDAASENMHIARDMLAAMPRTADEGLQLALVATSDFVLSLGLLTDGYDSTTGRPETLPQLPADLSDVQDILPVVQTDLTLMSTGLQESGLSENVAEDINQILAQLSSTSPAAVVTFLTNIQ